MKFRKSVLAGFKIFRNIYFDIGLVELGATVEEYTRHFSAFFVKSPFKHPFFVLIGDNRIYQRAAVKIKIRRAFEYYFDTRPCLVFDNRIGGYCADEIAFDVKFSVGQGKNRLARLPCFVPESDFKRPAAIDRASVPFLS